MPSADQIMGLAVAPAPTGGAGLALDETGLIPASVLPRPITGIVAADGTITAGTGFTVNKTGTGAYTLTWSSALDAAPIVQLTLVDAVGNGYIILLKTQTTTGATLTTVNPGVAAVDAAFNFTAQAVT